MSFAELSLIPALLKGIEECGYTTPTPIQSRAIPEALAGRDLLASAQTGTGKTAAFMLPALQLLSEPVAKRRGAPRVLVLTPTRELANQILEATRTYGRHLRTRYSLLLGGMPYREQFKALQDSPDLVVGTPGRVVDHLQRGSLDLSRLEILVLDEADRMLDMGFKDDLEKVIGKAPSGRQTLFFTATLDRAMADLAGRMLREPVRIDIGGRQKTHDAIEQRLHVTDSRQHKEKILQHLVADKEINQAIIFSATKRDTDSLARELSAQGHRVAALHGDMSQQARNRTLRDLRQGRIKLLVATDVAARGIDVTSISHVINFDLPMFAEDYVHRIGRTGRAGAAGTAISMASAAETAALGRIERYIGKSLPRQVIPGLEPTRGLDARPARNSRGPARSGAPRKPGDRSARSPERGKREFPAKQRGERSAPIIEYRSRRSDHQGGVATGR
ncbi:DEAD/DEAH box helicase [Trichloromonas sp.]|uniref:DEAD/DEAH box helicase n=1 Tax=Trichloromonas sp. TaxID=3069249 RepID=UPI002A41AD8E|nr:DEAD/DEAH box helicase [Trichloromonas sp.]